MVMIRGRIKKNLILMGFVLLFILSFFISIGNGAVKVSPAEIVKAILFAEDTVHYQVIWNVRVPRTIVGALVGICLSLSGAILQGIMRNPLAGPNIIGVSSGGGLMALIILILFPKYYHLVPLGAFTGALMATLFIYGLSWRMGVHPTRLILAGVAVSSLLNAGINGLITFFPDRGAQLLPEKLNILMLGDEVATGLGLNVEKTRFAFIILSSLLAGSAVSVVGLLGFVGLIVPHMARLFIGSDYRYLFPAAVFLGGAVVMLCDTLARVLFAPAEVPVGIIMSALGAPFFLYLLRKKEAIR